MGQTISQNKLIIILLFLIFLGIGAGAVVVVHNGQVNAAGKQVKIPDPFRSAGQQ